jgi:hypothetical protein
MNCKTFVSWNMSYGLPMFIIIDVWSVDTCRLHLIVSKCLSLHSTNWDGIYSSFSEFLPFCVSQIYVALTRRRTHEILRLTFTVIIMKTKIFRWWHIYKKIIKIIIEQDKHLAFSVILRRVSATIAAVEKRYHVFRMCVCSLSYPACNSHEQHCHL